MTFPPALTAAAPLGATGAASRGSIGVLGSAGRMLDTRMSSDGNPFAPVRGCSCPVSR